MFRKGKISEALCEDFLFQSENYIAVIDGVTSKTDFRYEGKTTGRLAGEIICHVFETLRADETLSEITERINRAFAAFYDRVDFPYDKKEKGLQAACVIYSAHFREIWMVGDCQTAVDGTVFFNFSKSDLVLAEMRSLILFTLEQERRKSVHRAENAADRPDPAREIILPWIVREAVFANDDATDYGYSVFNGEPIPESLVKIIRLDPGIHEVILTSDGYPEVKKTLQESEAYLEALLHEDPGCWKKYRSTKGTAEGQASFDDRTYVRFLL